MIGWIRWTTFIVTVAAISAFVALPGCTTGAKKDADKAKDKDKEKDKGKDKKDHDHPTHGKHGGVLIEWDPYHAELTIDHAQKMAVVYVVDDDISKAADFEPSRLSKVTLSIPAEKITLELKHDAKKSGPTGLVYTGQHDFFAKEAKFSGEVSGILADTDKKKDAKGLAGEFTYEPKKK